MEPLVIKIKKQLVAKKQKGLALDIDETLSSTLGFWIEKLQIKFGNPEKLTIEEFTAKYKYVQNAPYWQTPEALNWLDQLRNNDKLHEELPLIENSNLVVQKINKIIHIIAYISTRPSAVTEGTRKWLRKHNFPETEVISRPSKVSLSEGNQWKAKVLEFLYPEILGIVDDHPGLVSCLSANYQGTVYLYNNVDCQRKDIRVIPCKTWPDVLRQIRKNPKNSLNRISS